MARLRVLIVDDEDDMRSLLRSLIEVANGGLSVAAEASDGEAGLTRWREERPEVVLMDQRMPGPSGLDTAARILAEQPSQPIVLFSAYLDEGINAAAARIGIRACVSKSDARQLVDRLRECAAAAQ